MTLSVDERVVALATESEEPSCVAPAAFKEPAIEALDPTATLPLTESVEASCVEPVTANDDCSCVAPVPW